ncbi:BON domain-containing protein [Roseibium aggregatum]|uniref:BON domain-containing protein n=1 Tax=Roseibium aggregatum TaxID=187304 RepID=A0A926P1T9_9HYPH|nr:BON domain-containing protein [Roseibium aggregatum]MBD1544907.1 BON domain-containing protein [Roseibium aggregatum]
MTSAEFTKQAYAALKTDRRIDPHFRATTLELDTEGTVTLEGEVGTVGQKRLVLERIAALPGVSGIVDRLRVKPAEAMSDAGILDHIRKALLQEPAFQSIRIAEERDHTVHVLNDLPEGADGEIVISVSDGVVTLNGELPSLTSKRIAGVLAWWVPGSCDVINGISVEPEEEDAPIRIEEAVHLALELDPFVNASQVRVGVRGRAVRLTGLVGSQAERTAAEADAWYVFGVDEVINEIEVQD